ncbi:MAG TPA: hypothetical protein VH475_22710 [Tepidisphaeraceae bacterium]
MGIRETLNTKPGVVTGATIGVIVLVIIVIFLQTRTPKVQVATRAYYTVDDGQSVFEDEMDKAAPFEHGGQMAVRAHMFSCDGGKTRFIGFLEKVAEAPKVAPSPDPRSGRRSRVTTSLIKAPKDAGAKWVAIGTPEAAAVQAGVRCPNGDDKPMEVFAQ